MCSQSAGHRYREIPLPPHCRPLPIRLAKHKRVRGEDRGVLIVASLGKPHRCQHHKSKEDHNACHDATPKLPATFHWNSPFDKTSNPISVHGGVASAKAMPEKKTGRLTRALAARLVQLEAPRARKQDRLSLAGEYNGADPSKRTRSAVTSTASPNPSLPC